MTLALWLFPIWAIWMTMTTAWAVVPVAAWTKWDWAFKTACFAGLIPFLFRKRGQLEALLLTIAFSVAGYTMAGAVKTLLNGGGYGLPIGLQEGNSGLAEGATMACLAISMIPIMLYMHEHSNFIRTKWISFWLFYGLSAANVITCIGTNQRTGLISLAVLVFVFFFRSRRKLTYAALAVGVVVLASSYVLSQGFLNRMDTLNAYQTDRSAMVRNQGLGMDARIRETTSPRWWLRGLRDKSHNASVFCNFGRRWANRVLGARFIAFGLKFLVPRASPA